MEDMTSESQSKSKAEKKKCNETRIKNLSEATKKKRVVAESKFEGHNPAKVSKGQQTKVPCDYCGEFVTLATYVSHCKKLHSVRGDDEGCKRKCFRCGAWVHIIAQKFHDNIYHPVSELKPKGVRLETSLDIVEHNKTLTQVPCDFCEDRVIFGSVSYTHLTLPTILLV